VSRYFGWIRIAILDLRGGAGRFVVLLACLALGVATIAAVGSVGAMLQSAIDRDARLFLGGDVEAQLGFRPAGDAERALFAELGAPSEVIEVSTRATSDGRAAFLSLKAVDSAYPLIGSVTTAPAAPLADLFAERDGIPGAIVDPLLLDRLAISIGETFTLGGAEVEARAELVALPDQAAQGFQLGVPVLVSTATAEAAGILQPGVLAQYRYKIALDPSLDAVTARQRILAAFPDTGWDVRTPRDAARDLSRFFDVFSRFLVLVGLSTLIVGGVGVSNAVSAYITDRQRAIATFKSLGATSARITVHFLVQVLVLSSIGIAIGLVLGALSTALALPLLGNLLSIELPPTVHLASLATAALFGLLIGFAFAFLPLVRAEKLRPALLFRSASAGLAGGALTWRDLLRWQVALPLLAAAGAILALALVTTTRPEIVLGYAGGAVVAFIVLRLAAFGLQHGLRLVPPVPSATVRNAIKSIYRPGAPTATVVLSLGLGLTLVLMIALIDANIRGQLDGEIAREAPDFVFINMQPADSQALTAFAADNAAVETIATVPMLRGVVTSIDGRPASELSGVPGAGWMVRGDTNLTWSRTLPEGSTLTEGDWWPEDYAGEPLVSLSDQFREPLDLEIGDAFEISVLGRPITATIASFRQIEWDNRGFNFMIVLSPGLIESAPATYLGTLKAEPGEADAVQSALVRDYPALPFIPVGEALERAAGLLASLANAVAIVGGLAVLSGVLVLAGALAAGRRQREADAVVMKVLGSSRRKIALGYLVEYGLLGLLAALVASVLGSVGAWAVVTRLLELPFALDLPLLVLVMVGASAVTILTGLATTWSALSLKPAGFLRAT
jgi:putative ABC transport system permease protein